jgi:NhaP-type Na+/H+ or K+/H+ antiporter
VVIGYEHGANPALTVSLALAAGLIAQVLAQHVRIPGIVLLLATGALLGPDVLGVVRPHSLGSALHTLVGFAVAVILFEGGLNLDLRRLRRGSSVIQRLITIGALVTVVGASLTARLVLGWEWRPSILFGTLVIVTGPTVIGPLLRRIRIRRPLQAVLEAEGVLIDAVGAITAVVALDIALRPSFPSLAIGVLEIAASLGVGCFFGLVGGWVIARILRLRRLIPEGLENVFTLSMVLALFHISSVVQEESGIAAVTIAGVVVGNVRGRVLRDLMEFKEQLTLMFIGMLFVLLAADVRFDDIRGLGMPGLVTAAVLMLVVRPLNVLVATSGSHLTWRDRAFIAWIAPRGIVAAAVASFFAGELEHAGIEGGPTLRAMVFLVIAVTVAVAGLTGGFVARLLGVRRQAQGFAILSANDLALTLGRALRSGGEEVLFLDSNADASHAAERSDFRVVFGNALEESTLQRAGLAGVAACIGLTPNEEVNLLFARKAREEFKVPRAYVALHLNEGHVTPKMIHDAGAHLLFGGQRDLRLWESCMRRDFGDVDVWEFGGGSEADLTAGRYISPELENAILPIVLYRGSRAVPVDEATKFRANDRLCVIIFRQRRDEVVTWLTQKGWTREEEAETAETVDRR